MDKIMKILVTGATGRQGGAVASQLLREGFHVRILTRNPENPKAVLLKKKGAEIIKGDFSDPQALKKAMGGVYGVFSVQNPWITGLDKEVEYGVHMADIAYQEDIAHFVYASAGNGKDDTGVPHFNSKRKVEKHIIQLGLPYTIIRAAGFMELMSDKDFVPPLAAWNVTEKILGRDFQLYWIAVQDIGRVVAQVFKHPEEYTGKEINIAGDYKSMAECREIYESVYGKKPFRIPAPVWLFKLMQKDLWLMYQWMLSGGEPDNAIEEAKKLIGSVTGVEEWMKRKKAGV
jgi:uncharacterized protein YbjT (DUF2867 family)